MHRLNGIVVLVTITSISNARILPLSQRLSLTSIRKGHEDVLSLRGGEQSDELSRIRRGGDSSTITTTTMTSIVDDDDGDEEKVEDDITQINNTSSSNIVVPTAATSTRRSQEKKEKKKSSAIKSILPSPIFKSERPQFQSLTLLLFLTSFLHGTIRDTKDALVIPNCGSESIPFLKLYGTLPCSIGLISCIIRSKGMVNMRMVVKWLIPMFFGVFYLGFAFWVFPNREWLHFGGGNGGGGEVLDLSGKVMNLLRCWSFALFYVVSDLWSCVGIPVVFWQVANDLTSTIQAKRIYSQFAILGNIGPILSGLLTSYLSSIPPTDTNSQTSFGIVLQQLSAIQTVVLACIVFVYNDLYSKQKIQERKREMFVNTMSKFKRFQDGSSDLEFKVIIDRNASESRRKQQQRQKSGFSLVKYVKSLYHSKEIKSMSIMIICYNACQILTDVTWKNLILKNGYKNELSYMNYLSSVTFATGISSVLLQYLSSTTLFKSTIPWNSIQLMLPLTMLLSSILFLSSPFFGSTISTSLLLGTIHVILTRIIKYACFDPTKEILYGILPLKGSKYASVSADLKTRGKLVLDALGSNFGQALGGWIHQILLVSKAAGIPYSALLIMLYVFFVGSWTTSVSHLGKQLDFTKDDESIRINVVT